MKIIRSKITIYLVIKQNIFEFSRESRVHENEHSAGKSQCVSWFIETKSDIHAQQNFRHKYGRKPPARPTIQAWHKMFIETDSVLQRKGAGRPQISEEKIKSVQVAYIPEQYVYTRSPRNSICGASPRLQIPRCTIHKVLYRN